MTCIPRSQAVVNRVLRPPQGSNVTLHLQVLPLVPCKQQAAHVPKASGTHA
jgi:hypothetical protein